MHFIICSCIITNVKFSAKQLVKKPLLRQEVIGNEHICGVNCPFIWEYLEKLNENSCRKSCKKMWPFWSVQCGVESKVESLLLRFSSTTVCVLVLQDLQEWISQSSYTIWSLSLMSFVSRTGKPINVSLSTDWIGCCDIHIHSSDWLNT